MKLPYLYKCTYSSLEGAACPLMGEIKQPDPLHCHAYDTSIWNINVNMTCKYLMQLEVGEAPQKKIWCDDMPMCDAYNDGGIRCCETCPAKIVVFDIPNEFHKNGR